MVNKQRQKWFKSKNPDLQRHKTVRLHHRKKKKKVSIMIQIFLFICDMIEFGPMFSGVTAFNQKGPLK